MYKYDRRMNPASELAHLSGRTLYADAIEALQTISILHLQVTPITPSLRRFNRCLMVVDGGWVQ